ncbi:MAG: L-threonylcarbamoyladenylate synthase [Pyrinomonadaceae bacterium]
MILKYSDETQMQAASVIARGGVIAFRTDTFYGLGADPFHREAVQKIKQLKGREDHNPHSHRCQRRRSGGSFYQ